MQTTDWVCGSEASRDPVYVRVILIVFGFLLCRMKDPPLRAERLLFSILHRDYDIGCASLLSFDLSNDNWDYCRYACHRVSVLIMTDGFDINP
jgi:hypothetical protein